MAGARRKLIAAASSKPVSLVLERSSSLARSEKVDLGRLVDPRSAAWDEALSIAPLSSRDSGRSNCFRKICHHVGNDNTKNMLDPLDHRLLVRDPWLDRLEAKLDARFDEVRKMLQELFVSSRAEESAVEDIEEEAAVVEKEQDDEAITTSEEEEEVAEEAVAKEEMIESEYEGVASENKEVVKERNNEAHLPILISDSHFDPFLILCDKQGRKNERNLLLVAILQLSEYCPPGVCKNALKGLGLQFVVEMGMVRVVGDEMLLPLPRPPPKPPPELPPRT